MPYLRLEGATVLSASGMNEKRGNRHLFLCRNCVPFLTISKYHSLRERRARVCPLMYVANQRHNTRALSSPVEFENVPAPQARHAEAPVPGSAASAQKLLIYPTHIAQENYLSFKI